MDSTAGGSLSPRAATRRLPFEPSEETPDQNDDRNDLKSADPHGKIQNDFGVVWHTGTDNTGADIAAVVTETAEDVVQSPHDVVGEVRIMQDDDEYPHDREDIEDNQQQGLC